MTSPLTKKLLLKPNHRIALVNAPDGYAARLEPLPEGATLVEEPGDDLDFVQVFVRNANELERYAAEAVQAVRPGGLLWITYPKGGKKAGTDLNRDILWELMKQHGLAGVSLVAIDDTWSAMRFRPEDQVGR